MEQNTVFVDMLKERRKDCDILWATRPMDPLEPHKLPSGLKYNRDEVIKSVLANARVRHAIDTVAAAMHVSVKNIENNARAILNEMASKEDLPTVRWLGIFITKAMKRMFSRIYINESKLFNLKQEMQLFQTQYIYVPSHRSYLDFILLSYILFSYDMALPNIASGIDFYNMKIVGELLRKTGAFYMRRSFSDDLLYKEIFRSYISTIVAHSSRAIEFFIEGTRSRSQKSIMPKYGLLSMILDSLIQGDVPDIYFIPISICYERPPEELLFVYEMLGVPKPKESTTGLFRSLSILQKPFSHGCIFFNIAEPISAYQFIASYRKMKILSPDARLPSSVLENIAHLIIESHKKNTVLMPINIIALLLNERIQIKPEEPYTLGSLVKDYQWFKNFVTKSLNASMHPKTEIDDNIEQEILESLKSHDEFIVFDSSNILKLKQRYKVVELKNSNIKGHLLSERIMQVAVPAINITIYINPIFAYLATAALITATIEEDGIQTDDALERYELLRRLLSTEFVMRPLTDKDLIKAEWKESLSILLSEKCLHMQKDLILPGENKKLFFILHNMILPFIDVLNVMYTLLSEWNEEASGELTDRAVLVATQKEVERLILEEISADRSCSPHPYCLSLDLYNATLSNLLSQSIIAMCQERRAYRVDKLTLTNLVSTLRKLPLRRPVGTYIDALPSIISSLSTNVPSKL